MLTDTQSRRVPVAVDDGVLPLATPRWRPVPTADGLVAFLPGHLASTAWVDVVLTHDEDGFVVWAATGTNPTPAVEAATRRTGVTAVSLAAAVDDPSSIALALRFARRLANIPRADQLRPPVTSLRLPDATGWMPLPHLLTVRPSTGVLTSVTVWELRPLESRPAR